MCAKYADVYYYESVLLFENTSSVQFITIANVYKNDSFFCKSNNESDPVFISQTDGM